MTNRDRLREAMNLVSEAKKSLDVETHTCPTCSLGVAMNWSEKQAAETLSGVFSRLNKLQAHEGLKEWLDR